MNTAIITDINITQTDRLLCLSRSDLRTAFTSETFREQKLHLHEICIMCMKPKQHWSQYCRAALPHSDDCYFIFESRDWFLCSTSILCEAALNQTSWCRSKGDLTKQNYWFMQCSHFLVDTNSSSQSHRLMCVVNHWQMLMPFLPRT